MTKRLAKVVQPTDEELIRAESFGSMILTNKIDKDRYFIYKGAMYYVYPDARFQIAGGALSATKYVDFDFIKIGQLPDLIYTACELWHNKKFVGLSITDFINGLTGN